MSRKADLQRDNQGRFVPNDVSVVYAISRNGSWLGENLVVHWEKRSPVIAHTHKCIYRSSKYAFLRMWWEGLWPNHCTNCWGQGVLTHYENGAPMGSGENWQMPVDDFCPVCIEQGCCPRCGEQIHADNDRFWEWVEHEEPCPFCDWQWEQRYWDSFGQDPPICFCHHRTSIRKYINSFM